MKIPTKQPEWRIYNPGGKLAFCSINHPRKKFAHSFSTYSHLKNSPRFRRDHHLSRLPNSIHIEKAHLPRLWKSFGNRIKTSFYASTSDVASSTSLPNWWPLSNLDDKHITFADHVAHVIVPHTTDKQITKDCNSRDVSTIDEKDLGLNCENIVQWVLYHAQNKTSQYISQSNGFDHFIDACESVDSSSTSQRARICDEWNYCERMSEISIHRTDISERRGEDSRQYNILDPAFRHDPSLLPQRSNIDDNGRHLNAAELFALGSVWYLPYSSSTTIVDRFDPSSGVKPQRLNVGDMNRTVSWGDYFRIHFNPRRFTETNRFDWGSKFEDGHAGRSGQRFNKKGHDVQAKPGIVVARDDDVGYLVINKPPNVPVHPTVDNLLENVASSIGRCLWNERKDEILSGEYALNHTTIKQREDVHPSSNNTIQYTQNSKIKKRRQKKEPLVYVATPQRLDQNTSGLLVVASKKSFAAYFAKLLRTKTSGQLISGGAGRNSTTNIEDINLTLASKSKSPCGVHKSYRCLVCIMPKTKFSEDAETIHTGSMMMEVERLRKYQTQGTVIRHFLEPSIRAPKRFLTTIPVGVDDAKSWAECLLKITKVGDVCTVVGNAPSDSLARELWGMHGKPNETCAVAELEIELLTGRTHQIRGQLAAMNFPLVGDVQYGGAVPSSSTLWQKNYGNKQNPDREIQSYIDSEKLALQCCSLEFLDPTYSEDEPVTNAKRSNRWHSFRLDNAFWTSFLQNYHDESAKLSSSEITSILDEEMTFRDSSHDIQPSSVGAELNVKLPPRVLLSHGTNKYIIVKAWRPDRETLMGLDSDVDDPNVLWFVRSASPSECGGPYHANVAEGILRELAALGFMTKVTGGGRIDYCVSKEMSHAHVFGFSYGFGKGNHELVASIIEDFTDVIATYDNSDNLY